MSTLIEVIAKFGQRQGLEMSSSINTQDENTLQCVGLLNELLEDLVTRPVWQQLRRVKVYSAIAGEDQGSLTALTSDQGAIGICHDTVFNQSTRLALRGPMTPQEYAMAKTLQIAAPNFRWRMLGDHFTLFPAVTGNYIGQQIYFEYTSTAAVLSAGGEWKNEFTEDTDTCVLNSMQLIAGLRWKWRAEQGVEYAEQMRHYESLLSSLFNRGSNQGKITMDAEETRARPAIVIPPGNWNLG